MAYGTAFCYCIRSTRVCVRIKRSIREFHVLSFVTVLSVLNVYFYIHTSFVVSLVCHAFRSTMDEEADSRASSVLKKFAKNVSL